jgi:hypothetical protein
MQLAMTTIKKQKFANAKPISSIVMKGWKKSGQSCHYPENFEKMVATP